MQVSEATREVFAAFDTDGSRTVSKQLFIRFLANRGLRECDQRLEVRLAALDRIRSCRRAVAGRRPSPFFADANRCIVPPSQSMFKYLNSLGTADVDVKLTLEQFNEAITGCRTLVDKCVNGKLRVPDFKHFTEIFSEVYDTILPNTGGANAGPVIPQHAFCLGSAIRGARLGWVPVLRGVCLCSGLA